MYDVHNPLKVAQSLSESEFHKLKGCHGDAVVGDQGRDSSNLDRSHTENGVSLQNS